jgi:Na+/melibiose symporter-like transporter
LANQLGIALGFILSSALVDTVRDQIGALLASTNLDLQASDLPFFMILSAMSCTLACVLFIFFFQSAPDLPPTAMAASAARKDESTSYWRPYWIVLKNRDFVLLLIAFSISLGCIFALSTLLDQLLHPLQYTNVRPNYTPSSLQ